MRAAIATAVDAPLSISDRNVPEAGPGEVLVKITACGVCFSDLNLVRGHYPFARFPVVPGHEITGTVVAVGPGVTWPEVGTAVGAQFLYDSCGHCGDCARGEQILCTRKRITGVVVDGGRSPQLTTTTPAAGRRTAHQRLIGVALRPGRRQRSRWLQVRARSPRRESPRYALQPVSRRQGTPVCPRALRASRTPRSTDGG